MQKLKRKPLVEKLITLAERLLDRIDNLSPPTFAALVIAGLLTVLAIGLFG